MATERVLSNLNLISFKTEGGLQNHIDELQDGDLVFTPDNSLKGTLLDFKWADHLLNDMSWLRADTFSWQSGDVYVSAYNHLVADFEGTTAETTTIDGIEITYYLADDKHIICLPDQEDKLLELYNKTGVAWYYILDTVNKQFKLPRTKFGFTGLRDEVGGYVEAGLPNITGSFSGGEFARPDFSISTSGAIYSNSISSGYRPIGESGINASLEFDASRSSSIYGNSDTVQERATQMYLYFYVGNFERDAVEQTAGATTEMFNNKADVDLSNMNASQSAKDTIVGWGMPDYTAGVSVANDTVISGFTAPEKGILMLGGGAYYPKINGIDLANGSYYTPNNIRFGQTVPIQLDKGDTFSCQSYFVADACTNVFYPFKGVN